MKQLVIFCIVLLGTATIQAQITQTIKANDGVPVTSDFYLLEKDAPLVLLCTRLVSVAGNTWKRPKCLMNGDLVALRLINVLAEG